MARKISGPKWRVNRSKYLATFQRSATEGADWKPRRIITVDIRNVPVNEYDARLWFMGLLGRIWWDVTDTESAAGMNQMLDQFIALSVKAREEWVAERSDRPPHDSCSHRIVDLDREARELECRNCGKRWTVQEVA